MKNDNTDCIKYLRLFLKPDFAEAFVQLGILWKFVSWVDILILSLKSDGLLYIESIFMFSNLKINIFL